MTVRAFRIVKSKYAAGAFDGEGARLFGGRWNSPGVGMVYTSGTLPLAVLEILVHLQSESILSAYVVYDVDLPADSIEAVEPTSRPADWRAFPGPPALRVVGETWIRRGSSVALRVPSTVLATEVNYLLNPSHPGFRRLNITGPRPLDVDSRVFRR